MIQQSHSWASIWRKLIQKDTSVHCSIIAKTWQQPKGPLTDGFRRCGTYTQWNTLKNNE